MISNQAEKNESGDEPTATANLDNAPVNLYKLQHRGGKGIIGQGIREGDRSSLLLTCDTHDKLMCFSNSGRVHTLKCHQIPSDRSRGSKGTAIINYVPIKNDEKIVSIVIPDGDLSLKFVVIATRLGKVKRVSAKHFSRIRSNGIIVMRVDAHDELAGAVITNDNDEIMLITKMGRSIKFTASELRQRSRMSGGVRGIRLSDGDEIVGLEVASPDNYLLVVSSQGYGKITPIDRYSRQRRGGRGVKTMKVTPKTGDVTAASVVTRSQRILMMSAKGKVLHIPITDEKRQYDVPVRGRNTQGVILMRLNNGDRVTTLTVY